MRTLTMEETGKSQSHWRRKPNKDDLAAVRGIVAEAVSESGMDCSVRVWINKGDKCDPLGYYPVTAVMKLRNPVPVIRDCHGNTIKGMSEIRVNFYRKAAMLDYDKYTIRQKVESNYFATLPAEKAKAAIDALPWDGDTFDYKGWTNGRVRGYRRRNFYPYEGGTYGYKELGGSFGYANTWENLKKEFSAYVRTIALDTGYGLSIHKGRRNGVRNGNRKVA